MRRALFFVAFLSQMYLSPADRAATRGGGARTAQDARAGAAPSGQSAGAQEQDDEDVVRVDTSLVPVPVSVLDRDGRFVADLRREDFRVFEDGVEQQVAFFATVEQPFTVALLIDRSPSTRRRRQEIREAAVAFIERLRPNDRVMVVAFDSRIRVVGKAAKDREALRKAILDINWDTGGTFLYGTVDALINHFFPRIRGRKALVMLTDGEDNDARLHARDPKRAGLPKAYRVKDYGASCREIPCATYKDNMRDVEESDVLIYPINFKLLDEPPRVTRGGEGDLLTLLRKASGEQYLQELARKTGGRFYEAGPEGSLGQTFNSIAEELRHQYSLGFYAKESGQPGRPREIRVRVSRPDLAVRARTSYVYARPKAIRK